MKASGSVLKDGRVIVLPYQSSNGKLFVRKVSTNVVKFEFINEIEVIWDNMHNIEVLVHSKYMKKVRSLI
jgi:hypothetical protein